MYWDSFDCQVQCEEIYSEEPFWEDACVADITVDGIPLDGHYVDHLFETAF